VRGIESLNMAEKMGIKIETVIIGVEPKIIDWGMELSEEVEDKIPAIIEATLKEG
jgi:hydrogenase maturation protease